jgi:hypothetical protein
LNLTLNFLFSCNLHVPDVIAFQFKLLKTNFKPKRLFGDVADLGRRMATNILTGDESYVPWSALFTAGFSSKSRTSMSSKAAKNVNCLQNQDPETTSATLGDFLLHHESVADDRDPGERGSAPSKGFGFCIVRCRFGGAAAGLCRPLRPLLRL